MEAGPGLRKGQWLNLGVQDGLPSATVPAMLQDRKGDLWFSIDKNGVCRYDGAEFQIFTEDDGLAHWALYEHKFSDWHLTTDLNLINRRKIVASTGRKQWVFSLTPSESEKLLMRLGLYG